MVRRRRWRWRWRWRRKTGNREALVQPTYSRMCICAYIVYLHFTCAYIRVCCVCTLDMDSLNGELSVLQSKVADMTTAHAAMEEKRIREHRQRVVQNVVGRLAGSWAYRGLYTWRKVCDAHSHYSRLARMQETVTSLLKEKENDGFLLQSKDKAVKMEFEKTQQVRGVLAYIHISVYT